jgi:hypothetical protein
MNLFFLTGGFLKADTWSACLATAGGVSSTKKAQQAVPAEELQSELDYRTLTALANTTYFHLWLDITNEA